MERRFEKRLLLSTVLSFVVLTVCSQTVKVEYNGNTARVSGKQTDALTWTANGAHVTIENIDKSQKLSVSLKGNSTDGSLTLSSKGGAVINLEGVSLTSQDGAPIHVKKKLIQNWWSSLVHVMHSSLKLV